MCAEAIRRDLSVYLPVNAVATVPEIYDDPHYGTRSRPSRFKAPKTLRAQATMWDTRVPLDGY